MTDHMEIGFAAPLVALALDGSRVNTYRGRAFTQATASARATGLADLVVRTKYNVFDGGGSGIAAHAHLHEADLENLRGRHGAPTIA